MNKLPNKLKSKLIENWLVTYINYNGQDADFHTRMVKHLSGNKNFIGEDRQIYYFQFESQEKIDAFLRIMEKSFNNLNINTK